MIKSESFDNLLKKQEVKDPELKRELPLGTKLVEMGMMIQHYRDQHHFIQSQLAYKAHMPQSSIARIENGDNVNMKSLFRLLTLCTKI